MRTNIEIDDKLMKKAMRLSGAKTKKAAVEEGLRTLVRIKGQGDIRKLFGKVEWEGDLERSRGKDKWIEAEARENAAPVPAKSGISASERATRKTAA